MAKQETELKVDDEGFLKEVPVEAPREVKKGRLLPITIEGVDLKIMMRLEDGREAEFGRTVELIEKLREKFGNDILLEELQQLNAGTIESIRLIGGPKQKDSRIPREDPRRNDYGGGRGDVATGGSVSAPPQNAGGNGAGISQNGNAGSFQQGSFADVGGTPAAMQFHGGNNASGGVNPGQTGTSDRGGYRLSSPRFFGKIVQQCDPAWLEWILQNEPQTISQQDGDAIYYYLQERKAKLENKPAMPQQTSFDGDNVPF